MGTRTDMLRAELAVAELEEQFVAAKEAGTVTREMRDSLRDARRRHRLLRDKQAPAAGEARPATVNTEARSG